MDTLFDADLDGQLLALYRTRSLDVRLLGRRLRLDVPADVFSTFQVDVGTQALLRQIAVAGPTWATALDLGCGYGAICLAVGKAAIAQRADGVDRDALAVAFARHNARANGLSDAGIAGRLAYEEVQPRDYDAVICNLPAKAGEAVHRMMLLGAFDHLTADGEVWIVAVEPLAARIDEILAADAVRLRLRAARKRHVVYRYSFCHPPRLADAPYVRQRRSFRWKGQDYRLTALHGLAEFDSRSWASDLVLEAFAGTCRQQTVRRLMVCNPGQGHVPLLACRLARTIEEVVLVSRDRIALKASPANLLADGYRGAVRAVHTAAFSCGPGAAAPDAAVAVLREKEGLAVNVEKLRRLAATHGGCRVIAGCKSAFGSRLQQALRKAGIRAAVRTKKRGFCAVAFQ
jgi:SAM-dependent methyltransferase